MKRIELEKKKRILEENKKKQKEKQKEKEKEKKEQQKFNNSIKKSAEEELIMEEIKNNEFDKQNKEKDFYKTYLNSLQKRPNSFKKDFFKKDYDFTPLVYKHPEKIYLKAVYDYQSNQERMRQYNRRTGLFDLYLNRRRTNKFYIDADKKDTNNNLDNNNNDKFKMNKSNMNTKNDSSNIGNQNKKKTICINVSRGHSTGPYKTTTSYNIFLSNSTNSKLKLKNTQKKIRVNNSSKKPNSEEKGEITLDEMINFLLDKETERTSRKRKNVMSSKNYRKSSEQKKRIINSLNDPCNPYSAFFYNNILYNNYRVGMHYKDMEQGVPYLRIQKMKKSSLPPISQANMMEERMLCNTYSSGFNLNRKKKMFILQSNANQSNKSNSCKKGNSNDYIKSDKSDKKEKNETNVLFQSYGEKTDFYNEDFEMPKFDSENKNKMDRKSSKEKKKLSGIIEEE